MNSANELMTVLKVIDFYGVKLDRKEYFDRSLKLSTVIDCFSSKIRLHWLGQDRLSLIQRSETTLLLKPGEPLLPGYNKFLYSDLPNGLKYLQSDELTSDILNQLSFLVEFKLTYPGVGFFPKIESISINSKTDPWTMLTTILALYDRQISLIDEYEAFLEAGVPNNIKLMQKNQFEVYAGDRVAVNLSHLEEVKSKLWITDGRYSAGAITDFSYLIDIVQDFQSGLLSPRNIYLSSGQSAKISAVFDKLKQLCLYNIGVLNKKINLLRSIE